MMRPGETKVSVHVEVVVEGDGQPRVTTFSTGGVPRTRWHPRMLDIYHPGGGGSTPVFPFYSGKQCIEADGVCLTFQGSYPAKVYAKVYPDPNLDPLHTSGLAVPPGDAASDTPDPVSGKWSFTQAKGNPVPGATCNGSGSGNNNTLVVWYDFGGGTPDSIEYTAFYGYCVSGSFGTGSPPATLHATFTGALAGLGTIALASTGAGWFGAASACGGAMLAFLSDESGYSLLAAGPGVAFSLSNPPDSTDPFIWSASGTATGSCAGAFDVTLTE